MGALGGLAGGCLPWGHPGSGAHCAQSLARRVRPPHRQRVPLDHVPLDQESIASVLADLRGRVSSLQGLASDLQGEKGKVSWWQSPRGLQGCGRGVWAGWGQLKGPHAGMTQRAVP